MTIENRSGGNPFGCHRVTAPSGVLPQPAEKLDNNFDILWDNELLVDVDYLNIDSASFTQIRAEQDDDEEAICKRIQEIVSNRGKMHNPVTGSGGMFIGRVAAVGEKLREKCELVAGDKIVSLVSLSLTPLKIDRIIRLNKKTDQAQIKGRAVLFENSLYARMPDDIPETLALAVLDVCGAPAQTARLVQVGQTVVVVGAGGKSGLLCCWEARKRAGINGRVIGIEYSEEGLQALGSLNLCDEVIRTDARNALECYGAILSCTDGRLADVVINCVNIDDTELSSIMMCRQRGKVYFFSMATSFTKAALGAEGIGKDVDMLVGNGYARGHAEYALDILRVSTDLRAFYETYYGLG